jgi:elongation factor 1-beta
MATFGDLSSKGGLEKLNEHLKTRSYIQSYQATQLDGSTYGQLKNAPSAKDYPHLSRWYNHIKSFGAGISQFPAAGAAGDHQNGVSKPAQDDEDDVDLFASDGEEDEEAAKVREQRLQEYADKKSKKAGPIAKSSVILDVKPWDDETDMKVIETNVRSIVMDGLVWGASKLVPVGYGINKLQIICVVEDDKVSIEALTEEIQNFEEYVQSVDVAAFNKI